MFIVVNYVVTYLLFEQVVNNVNTFMNIVGNTFVLFVFIF